MNDQRAPWRSGVRPSSWRFSVGYADYAEANALAKWLAAASRAPVELALSEGEWRFDGPATVDALAELDELENERIEEKERKALDELECAERDEREKDGDDGGDLAPYNDDSMWWDTT